MGYLRVHQSSELFKLKDSFLDEFKGKQPKWGPIGYITYKRTYSREIEDGVWEEFWQTAQRVVEGCYRIQQRHCKALLLPWNSTKAQHSAQEMYQRIWDFKFTPPGRGLWMMGTDYVEKRGSAALNNCSFVSTKDLKVSFSAPFCFLMDMSMVGVGVGGDTKGAGTVKVKQPEFDKEKHIIPDTREGWVELVRRILDSYVGEGLCPQDIDYSLIRPEGEKIKGFGGVASGPAPLILLVEWIHKILTPRIGQKITSADIVDLFNLVGKCVVSGNVRRSAENLLGEIEDEEFRSLKDPDKFKAYLDNHRWASNNSLFATVGMDYTKPVEALIKNGEPGFFWLDSAKNYSRMGDPPDYKDSNVGGCNPCFEQSLESFECCCLCETYPANHDSYEDFQTTLKYAYLYSKSVTLMPTHDPRTNAVMLRNRRIGTSMSGIVQAMNKHGRRAFYEWCKKGFDYIGKVDKLYSDWLCVPVSKKRTSVKPSGTVSLLCGATPGIHFPESEYYIRNIRVAKNSHLIPPLKKAGYLIEDDVKDPNSFVVSFPIHEKLFVRGKKDVTMWEQLELVAQMQQFWSDNQVSATIHFQKHEAKDIKNALELYEVRLKGISFLPLEEAGEEAAYPQMPYSSITKEKYEEMSKGLKSYNLKSVGHEITERGCDGDRCDLPIR